jgi:glycosyltransferase involved in cell wall biosynthesis
MTTRPSQTILVASNTSWSLSNFRLNLMKELSGAGYRVIAVAPADDYSERLQQHGIQFVPYPLDRRSTNPFNELLALFRLCAVIRRLNPDLILSYTPKINIYASLAARMFAVPIVNNVSGMGYAFIHKGILARLVTMMYRLAFNRSTKVFFQNNDDMHLFVNRIVSPGIAERLPGSGVDTVRFAPTSALNRSNRFVFLLVARMLRDKGVVEYVDAARIVRQSFPDVEFSLLGFVDVQNPAAISSEQMSAWVKEGVVRYLGATDNVKPYLAGADCVVLPSYREGTPRSLLEAAAMGKPIIATDAIGCRDVVDDGVTGFLCKLRDAGDLADKMLRMLRLSEDERREMGTRGREKMICEFDERIVLDKYMEVIRDILA